MTHHFSDKTVLPENIANHRIKIRDQSLSNNSLSEIESNLPVKFFYSSEKRDLTISYDASKVSLAEIISQLEQREIYPLKNWWFRIKVSIFGFTDENIVAQAHAKPKGCCNKLPHS
jgi:hypothetical protein